MEAARRRARMLTALVTASCAFASSFRVDISRRAFVTAATLSVAPLSSRAAADSSNAADCDTCVIAKPVSGSSSQKYAVGDFISLDAIPNPQLEAKKAMYRAMAGDYDVSATRAKLSSLIQSTPVVVFSLSG